MKSYSCYLYDKTDIDEIMKQYEIDHYNEVKREQSEKELESLRQLRNKALKQRKNQAKHKIKLRRK